MGDDSLQRQHHARLFWWLHVLLHHRARRPHHPKPLGRFGDPRNRRHPRQSGGLHRRDFRPRWPNGQHVSHWLQKPRDRSRLPQTQLRLPWHLPKPQHRPQLAHTHVSPCAGIEGREENSDRLWPALRLGREVARIRQRIGHAPCGRLPQNCPRAHRRRAAVQNDETGHWQLRQVQANV